MGNINQALALWAVAMIGATTAAKAQEPPVIPVGLDAYRQWERWPYLRVGQQTFMRSTYDRRGGNEGADASHFLYQLPGERSVPLDLEGPGVLNFVRYNHWHGSPWHYVVDGVDHVIRETSTADPDHPESFRDATFLPAELFPEPLAFTWATTRGADLIGVPIPFTRSFRMEYERTHYGTGYYIFSRYVPGARLSQPIKPWPGASPPPPDATSRRIGGRGVNSPNAANSIGPISPIRPIRPISPTTNEETAYYAAVLALINRSGTDIAPRPDTPRAAVSACANTAAQSRRSTPATPSC